MLIVLCLTVAEHALVRTFQLSHAVTLRLKPSRIPFTYNGA